MCDLICYAGLGHTRGSMATSIYRREFFSSRSIIFVFVGCVMILRLTTSAASEDPTPTPWPEQFHALLYQNSSGKLSIIDLWYDFPKGRNFNIIHKQLGSVVHDLEWTNGTSFYYDLQQATCRTLHFPVGILSPHWLVKNATYLGVRTVDGFECNVWSKADNFIVYYEDIETKRPVHWLFFTGMSQHVMTFEVGRVLEDEKWQAPAYCFGDKLIQESREQPLSSSEERVLGGLQGREFSQ